MEIGPKLHRQNEELFPELLVLFGSPLLTLAQALQVLRRLAVELRLEEEGEGRACKSSVPREALSQPWKSKALLGAVVI